MHGVTELSTLTAVPAIPDNILTQLRLPPALNEGLRAKTVWLPTCTSQITEALVVLGFSNGERFNEDHRGLPEVRGLAQELKR